MAQSFVNLLVKDNGFNATLKRAMSTFASLGNAANSAKGQFSKFADSISQVAQSQQMLNTALKGNPYGMLAQAATMAFTKIIEKATEATDAEKRAFEWQQQRAEMEQQAYEAIGKSTGELMAKYELLRVEWLNLSTDQQKNEWINKNKSAFQGLNLAVTDVTSAENVFVNNTSQVVAALKARAEAEAYAEMYKDQIKKNAMNKVNGKYNTQLITDPYYQPSEMEAQLAGFTLANKHENFEYKMVDNADPRNPGKHREWTGRLSQLGLQRLNANRQLGAASLENADRMLADQWAAKMAQAQANANALQNNSLFGSTGGKTGGGGGKNSHTSKISLPSIGDFDKALGKSLLNTDKLKEGVEMLSPYATMTEEAKRQMLGLAEATEDLGSAQADLGNNKVLEQMQSWVDAGKETEMSWRSAASAISSVGSAMAGIQDPSIRVAGLVAQAIGTIALAYAKALETDWTSKTSIYTFIAAAAASTASMIGTISAIHSASGYAEGGIVKGNSYSGDNVGPVMLDAGELILNRSQQATLANSLTGQTGNLRVTGILQGTSLVMCVENTLRSQGKGELATWKS